MTWCWRAVAMTSFKPLWTERVAADIDEGGTLRKPTQSHAGFTPMWQGEGQSREFAFGGSGLTSDEVPGDVMPATEPVAGDPALDADTALHVADVTHVTSTEVTPVAAPGIDFAEHERLLGLARAEGFEAGRAEGREQAAVSIEAEKKRIMDFVHALDHAFGEPERFLDPLKKIAVHVAREVVRGELQLSGAAITRLVDHCISAGGTAKPVAIHLNAHDIEWFKSVAGDGAGPVPVVADETLANGSVKVMLNDGWIEDMIEHRFEDVETSLSLR